MKPLYFSFLLFVPFALGARHYFVCDTLHWCGRTSLAPAESVRLAVATPGGLNAEVSLPAYAPGQARLPASASLDAALDSLAGVIDAEAADYALRIEAPVLMAEGRGKRHGRYADLGVARAAALAEALQARGISAERMTLHSYPATSSHALVPKLSFQPVVAKSLGSGLAPAALLADSMSFLGLRFGRSSSALEPEPAFAAYAEKLIASLNADTTLRLRLIGHTDDRSTRAHNDSLGRWRAEAVAAYLTQRGLATPVAVESRGATEPAADNATPEGRYLNRRVEARIE